MPRVYDRSEYVADSRSTARALAGLGVAPSAVTTIEMGASQELPFGERSTEPRFLVLGRLVPHKRVEKALECWPRVRAVTGGSLVVAGDGPELERLRSLATPGVEFTGYLTEEEKAHQLGAAWVLVHPAHHEGWGMVVIEAAAAGVPTVAFDVDGVRDSVDRDVTGLLVHDDDEFAESWIRLGTDAGLRDRMSDAARDLGRHVHLAARVDQFEGVLARAIERSGAGSRFGPSARKAAR